MTDLTLTCDRCTFPITGDTGCLSVSILAATQHRRAADDLHGAGPAPMRALVDHVLYGAPIARWRALHDACREPDEDAAYQIDAIKLATYSGLLWWTNHLMAKNWLQDTDWGAVLMEAGGHEAGRIAPVNARNAA